MFWILMSERSALCIVYVRSSPYTIEQYEAMIDIEI